MQCELAALRQGSVWLHVVYLLCFLFLPLETKALPKTFGEKPDLGQFLTLECRLQSGVQVDGVPPGLCAPLWLGSNTRWEFACDKQPCSEEYNCLCVGCELCWGFSGVMQICDLGIVLGLFC